jgi:hypothetical protein
MLRPTVWFTAASMVTTILHELTHACVAYALGVRVTLFSYFARLDPADGTNSQRALIRVSGPLLCLGLGALAWLAFRRPRGSATELPLLYLTVFGVGTFFGNLMSITFVGDFSSIALVLGLPTGARYVIAVIGALSVAAIHFWGGSQLVAWVPDGVGRAARVVGIVVLPAVLGTAAVILANQPMPPAFAITRFVEAAFWSFAVLGALATRKEADRSRVTLAVRWSDVAVLLLAVLAVRLMVGGIVFAF